MGFSENLQKLRREADISQKKLAKAIGVSQASVGYWEKGQRTPSISAVKKIAEYFGVNSSYLMDEDIRTEDIKRVQKNEPCKRILTPGDIVLEMTQENYEKYPMYFNAAFTAYKNIAFSKDDAVMVDLKTGKRMNNEEFKEELEKLPNDDKLSMMQTSIEKLILNPTLHTLRIYFIYGPGDSKA